VVLSFINRILSNDLAGLVVWRADCLKIASAASLDRQNGLAKTEKFMHDAIALPSKSRIPIKSVALPVEHGAWGFLFEPLLAGLLIAPTVGGSFLSIMIVGSFLSRQPLKFVVGDLLQKKKLPRTAVSRRWLAYFGAVAGFGLFVGLLTVDLRAFIPLIFAVPFVVYLILQDASRKSREMVAELMAASVLATSISSLSIAAGHGFAFAAAMWATMLARLIPSVIYVRNRLRLEKGKFYSAGSSLWTHLGAVVVVLALYFAAYGSILTVTMTVVLLVRSIAGLSDRRSKLTAKQIGVREVIYGVVYAVSVVVGFYFKI